MEDRGVWLVRFELQRARPTCDVTESISLIDTSMRSIFSIASLLRFTQLNASFSRVLLGRAPVNSGARMRKTSTVDLLPQRPQPGRGCESKPPNNQAAGLVGIVGEAAIASFSACSFV